MNGNRLFVDTNILLYYLKGNGDVVELIADKDLTISFVTELELHYRLKLPDSIIAASAYFHKLPLITADKAFQRLGEMNIILYEGD